MKLVRNNDEVNVSDSYKVLHNIAEGGIIIQIVRAFLLHRAKGRIVPLHSLYAILLYMHSAQQTLSLDHTREYACLHIH